MTKTRCGVANNIINRLLKEFFIIAGLYIVIVTLITLIFAGYPSFIIAGLVIAAGIGLLVTVWASVDCVLKNDRMFNCLNREASTKLKQISLKLDVAKKLQFFAEPAKDSITSNPELQFLYTMIPHDYISGDIFGIHTINNNETIFWVGDVIGHGIGAGLIMVAIQSIIQTLIIKNQNETLKDILIKLNNILYDIFDVTLQDSSYHTSFILLKYINNSIKFCGQHENIIHYNAKKNRFSIIDTSDYGINLGSISSTENIEQFIEYGIFEFAPEDTLILYSDGIVESTNELDEMYGIGRFIESLENEFLINKSDRTNEDIIMKILTDLKLWTGPKNFADDVTLIIVNNINKRLDND